MTELHTMYRVMILYMLNRLEYPLTNTQITNFILEKDYTNYFTVQQTIFQPALLGADHSGIHPTTIPAIISQTKEKRPCAFSATRSPRQSNRIFLIILLSTTMT